MRPNNTWSRARELRVPDAVRRWSGTFAKAVCATVPGLQRTFRARRAPCGAAPGTPAISWSSTLGGASTD